MRPKCQFHFPIGSRERIHSLVETCTFEEMDPAMTSVDVLNAGQHAAVKASSDRDRKATMLMDAVVTGIGKIGRHQVGAWGDGFRVSRRLDGLGGR